MNTNPTEEQFEEQNAPAESTENSNTESTEIKDETGNSVEASDQSALENEINERKQQYLRLYADFENYKKRAAKERFEFLQYANQEIIKSILPVLDDFERAIPQLEQSPDKELFSGINLINSKLNKILEDSGLKKVPVEKGDDFNVDKHEAITQIDAAPENSNKIVDVIETGYQIGDKIIRFPKVIVGK